MIHMDRKFRPIRFNSGATLGAVRTVFTSTGVGRDVVRRMLIPVRTKNPEG